MRLLSRSKLLLFTLGALVLSCSSNVPSNTRAYHPLFRFPSFSGALARTALAPLPLGSVKPRGWLKDQLQIQAAGLSGHIEEIWPDLGPSNAWRGGNGDAWERGPYYLDGLVPLAFLLDDQALLAKMQVWMDWNLTHQNADGSMGAKRSGDWWPDMVFLKALLQYAEASGDERVAPYLERYFKHLQDTLPSNKLNAWRGQQRYDEQASGAEDLVGQSDRWQYYRWMEMVQSLLWQYRRTADPSLLKTAAELKTEGFQWGQYFSHFTYKAKSTRQQIFLANHGVNNAMGLKANAFDQILSGKPLSAPKISEPLAVLNRWHGQANGTFAADEQLAGTDPSQGTELCTVVEEMYSLETMLWVSGDPALGDALERLAFNALPAALSEDCWRHQYDQQVNQIEVSNAPRAWSNNGPHANLFGLEPEWGCCTANYHQGWPKFVEHLWMATPDGGVALMSYAPSQLELELPSGTKLRAETTGSYPFDGDFEIHVTLDRPESFPIKLRIPAWVKGGSVNAGGQSFAPVAGKFLELKRAWANGDIIKVHFVLPTQAQAWGNGTTFVRGPLLFALDIEPQVNPLGKDLWSDTELLPASLWNLAPSFTAGAEVPSSLLESHPALTHVFDRKNPPLKLHVPSHEVMNWNRQDNSAGPLPLQPQLNGSEKPAVLIPYGAAKLRIAVFPRVPH